MPSTRSVSASGVVAAALLALTACGSTDENLAERQQAVAEAGAEVMPFNLDATTHIFTDSVTGGIQDVVADDPSDDSTIELIRLHLASEADKFRVGDFSDPEAIHGAGMPGLAMLQERYGDIVVELLDTDAGARITYTTEDDAVVAAIHDWFSAQSSDHGSHAQHETT